MLSPLVKMRYEILHRKVILKCLNKNCMYGFRTFYVVLIKSLPSGIAKMPCQPLLLVSVTWQCMGLRPLFHLQVVFEAPQVAICRPQGGCDVRGQESSLVQFG